MDNSAKFWTCSELLAEQFYCFEQGSFIPLQKTYSSDHLESVTISKFETSVGDIEKYPSEQTEPPFLKIHLNNDDFKSMEFFMYFLISCMMMVLIL